MGMNDERVITGYRKPLGYQQIEEDDLDAAIGLTLTDTQKRLANYAIIQSAGGIVRWRDDGTNPTASLGMRIPDGAELIYVGDLTAIKFIVESVTEGSTLELNISIYN